MSNIFWALLSVIALLGSTQIFATESDHSHKHKHDQIEISSHSEKPAVSLEVARDAVGGWNIYLKVKNFRFAPENVNGSPVPGEGHAHLYVDGEKVARLYGPWFHLGSLSSGRHTISVTLNANNHASLVLNGTPVEASAEIVQ